MTKLRWMLSFLAALSSSCLPSETRDTPGALEVSVVSQPSVDDAIATDDGWLIRFQRVLVVIGDVRPDGADCDPYSDSGYSRVLDLIAPSPQRLAFIYGLGDCALGFTISQPQWDTVAGQGVTEDDIEVLRARGDTEESMFAAVTVRLQGAARRAEVEKHFDWSLRPSIEYHDCTDAEGKPLVHFDPARASEVHITLDPSVFFRSAAGLGFEAFRSADDEHGNADGNITLEELGNTPFEGDDLRVELNRVRLPNLANVVGGVCQRGGPHREGGGRF